jgi:Xaa-Pro aminopeptidase
MLVLFPDNPDKKFREVLVLVKPNELQEKWDGRRLRKEDATAISGIETIIWLENSGRITPDLDSSRRYHLPEYK